MCSACGQLVSQCSEAAYLSSMREFDDPEGTWPIGSASRRLKQQTGRIIKKLEMLLSTSRNNIHLLDVGCSNGSFVSAACSYGVEAEGVEPSPGPAQHAVNAGLKVHQGFIEDVNFEKSSFDALTLFEVIEHLKDPLSLMKECLRILKPGGYMVLRTGNTDSFTVRFMKGRWLYFHLEIHGGHVSFYKTSTMKLLAEKAGFEVHSIRTHSVGLYEKGDIPYLPYRFFKIFSETLNAPSKLLGKGHEMIVFLRKPL